MVNGEHPAIAGFRHPAGGTPAILGGKGRFILGERDPEVSLKLLVSLAPATGSREPIGGPRVPIEVHYTQPGKAAAALLTSGLVPCSLISTGAQRRELPTLGLLLVVATTKAPRQVGTSAPGVRA